MTKIIIFVLTIFASLIASMIIAANIDKGDN